MAIEPIKMPDLFKFGDEFELDVRAYQLRSGGTPLKLKPIPMELLLFLLERRGEMVTREQIAERIWGKGVFLDTDNNINGAISRLRQVLRDDPEKPRFIQTVPSRGYRFIAPVLETQRVVAAISGTVAVAQEAMPQPVGSGSAAVPVSASLQLSDGSVFRGGKIWKVLIPAVLMLVAAAIGGAFYIRTSSATKLTDKDTIVLSDFTNTTGDSVFDDTLKQGLAIQLEQSPFLDVVSERRVNETLKLMGRLPGDRLTPQVTREVCQRTASKAMLTGSIAGLGSQYVIGLRVVNCETGDVLAETQEQAAGKEAVLKALDAAAVGLRSKLGESLNSVQKYATPLREATTPSLEALKAYSLGLKTWSTKGHMAALPLFKRAVELDPAFAEAYASISAVYDNLGQTERAAEYSRKAYELRGKASELERFAIETNYHEVTTGNLEKAAQVCELWHQTYPRDARPVRDLGFMFAILGNHEKALENARESLRMGPHSEIYYTALGADYMSLNQLDEAEAVFSEAEQRNLESETLFAERYQLAFLKGDTAEMAQVAANAMGKLGTEDLLLAAQAATEAWHGKLRNARELTQRAMESAGRNDAKETAATYQAAAALREVESGNWKRARADVEGAMKLAPNLDVREMAALALAGRGHRGSRKTRGRT